MPYALQTSGERVNEEFKRPMQGQEGAAGNKSESKRSGLSETDSGDPLFDSRRATQQVSKLTNPVRRRCNGVSHSHHGTF